MKIKMRCRVFLFLTLVAFPAGCVAGIVFRHQISRLVAAARKEAGL